jgi:hypothetical protein
MTLAQAIVTGYVGVGSAAYFTWLHRLSRRGQHKHVSTTDPRSEDAYITLDSENPGLL